MSRFDGVRAEHDHDSRPMVISGESPWFSSSMPSPNRSFSRHSRHWHFTMAHESKTATVFLFLFTYICIHIYICMMMWYCKTILSEDMWRYNYLGSHNILQWHTITSWTSYRRLPYGPKQSYSGDSKLKQTHYTYIIYIYTWIYMHVRSIGCHTCICTRINMTLPHTASQTGGDKARIVAAIAD